MKLFIKCEEANHTCDKNQYKEASFCEKVKLNFHLIYCAACRKYSARNLRLSRAFQKAEIKHMPQNQKDILKERIQKELSK
jgi:predicted anti-sigma-YlaC factor YlaD